MKLLKLLLDAIGADRQLSKTHDPHDDDDVTDCYRAKAGLAVFGFGRAHRARLGRRWLLWRVMAGVRGRLGLARASSGLLDRVPATLIIGLVEARDFEAVKARIDAIYRVATASV